MKTSPTQAKATKSQPTAQKYKPANRTGPAVPEIPRATLELSPFTVTTDWVKVTIPISKDAADFLDSENQTIRDGIGGVVSGFTVQPRLQIQYGLDVAGYKHLVAKAGRLPNGETRPWSFVMERWQWTSVESMAATLNATPEQFARAAISERVSQIREFLAERANKGGDQ